MCSDTFLRDMIHLSIRWGPYDVQHAQNMQYSMLSIQPHDNTFQNLILVYKLNSNDSLEMVSPSHYYTDIFLQTFHLVNARFMEHLTYAKKVNNIHSK